MPEFNYAERFERDLQQKYTRELTCNSLMNSHPEVKFINAQTIKLPNISVSGYKDHNRNNIGFNSGTATNEWEPKKLEHDRDIEIALDPMDVDETNLTAEMANITNTFEEEQAIPEMDSYVYSKLYKEATDNVADGAKIDTTVPTTANILSIFDKMMEEMDEAGVPAEGRELRLIPTMYTMIKNAEKIQRTLDVSSEKNINRNVRSLDDVTIIKVPSTRMKTVYDFTDGCVPSESAKQIRMMLSHPSCQITRKKYSYIKVFTPGTDSRTADKYIYQNRAYWDSFLLKKKSPGIAFNVEA